MQSATGSPNDTPHLTTPNPENTSHISPNPQPAPHMAGSKELKSIEAALHNLEGADATQKKILSVDDNTQIAIKELRTTCQDIAKQHVEL
jgi:hypothetical protein